MAKKEDMLKSISSDIEKAKKAGLRPTKITNRDPYPISPKKGRKPKTK